jgi:hypothetical protein
VQLNEQRLRLSFRVDEEGKFVPSDPDLVNMTSMMKSTIGDTVVKVKGNMVSFSGPSLPFCFFFTIELNKHNEIFLNSKIDVNKNENVRQPTTQIHGLIGQTFYSSSDDAATSAGTDDEFPFSSDRALSHSHSHRSHSHASSVSAPGSVYSSSNPPREPNLVPHDAVWHHAQPHASFNDNFKAKAGKVDFDFLDAAFLEGHLYDYELHPQSSDADDMQADTIWSDAFKFNKYQSA